MPNTIPGSQELSPGSYNDFMKHRPELSDRPAEEKHYEFSVQWMRYIKILAAERGVTPEDLHRQPVNYSLSDKD